MGEVLGMDRMVGDRAAGAIGPASRISAFRVLHLADPRACGASPRGTVGAVSTKGDQMVALIVLLLLLLLLGGLGFAAHVLWWILIAALVIWAIGFFIGGAADAGGRRGWYRW